jgi:hypothetical protein
MTRSRFRRPKAKPGELLVKWGYSKDDGEDIFYVNGGDGASQWDRSYMHGVFGVARMTLNYSTNQIKFEPSVLEELEARGYDLTTLRFSIRKKAKE